jgi:hypothetical protein
MNVSKVDVVLVDCGAASTVTRGDIYYWPWYENSAPPVQSLLRGLHALKLGLDTAPRRSVDSAQLLVSAPRQPCRGDPTHVRGSIGEHPYIARYERKNFSERLVLFEPLDRLVGE